MDIRFVEQCATKINLPKIRIPEICLSEICSTKICILEISSDARKDTSTCGNNRPSDGNTVLLLDKLEGANLHKARLNGANLSELNLSNLDLSETDLSETDLSRTQLMETNLSRATLSGTKLIAASLVRTNLKGAHLNSCLIHGISAWNIQLEAANQLSLIITDSDEPTITVDNLEVAQFIYLLLNNRNIRHVIEAIAYKVVLILGSFAPKRKAALDAIKDELRNYDYLPVVFDFDKPASQTMAETISTLAHLARFIIVDLTDPGSVPAELATIVPHCFVPVQPLLVSV